MTAPAATPDSAMVPAPVRATRRPDRLEVLFERVEQRVPRRLGPPALIRAMLRLGLPILLILLLVTVAMALAPGRTGEILTRLGSLFVIGKLAAAGGQVDLWYWFWVLGTGDVLFGAFFLLNFDLLKDVPRFGRGMKRMEQSSLRILETRPWVTRLSLLGVALIVFIPIHGTGTIAGSLMGRIIGLGPLKTLAAVAAGGYSGIMLVLVGSLGAAWLGSVGLWPLAVAVITFAAVALLVAVHRLDAGIAVDRHP